MTRRLPSLDESCAFFWTSGGDGLLRLRWCPVCLVHRHPSAEVCPRCLTVLDVDVVGGRGRVVALTVNEHCWPGAPDPPYTVVIVDLADAAGVRLTGNLVSPQNSSAEIGQHVSVRFEQHDDVWLPYFVPDWPAQPSAERDEQVEPPVSTPRSPASSHRFEESVVLSGVGTSEIGRRIARSEMDLTIEACRRAVADAGLTLADIDGLSCYPGTQGMPGVSSGGTRAVEQALGVQPTWHAGGPEVPGQLGGVIAGMLAVATGLCRHVLCWTAVHRDSLPSHVHGQRVRGEAQWRIPFGAVSPAHWIALAASQYFARFGGSRETLGWIAISAARHAARNPQALRQTPTSMQDYLSARPITTPFGLLDCDLPCDGAYAVVVSARSTTPDLASRPVRVAAVGTQITESPSWDQGTLTHQPGVFGPAAHLWTRTDLRPADVDVAALYDGFTFNALTWLEALGFCEVGEGADFVAGAERIGPGGSLPLNPHGGQLTAGRSNGFGQLHEAVHQLRGAAGPRQVLGAEVAVVSSGGGIPGGCLLLTGDR